MTCAKPPVWTVVRGAYGLALLTAASCALPACARRPARMPSAPIHARSSTPAATASGDVVLVDAARVDTAPEGQGPTRVGVPQGEVAACPDVPARWASEQLTKSYGVAAANILGYVFLLNQFDRRFLSEEEYGSDLGSVRRNLSGGWGFDEDPFRTNQFLHPYGGAIYHGFARSAGLDFWESLGYDAAASALWEVAGETTPPSINDQVTTPLAGAFLGEALFRSASLMLERTCGRPSAAAELRAALVSPSTGVTRMTRGSRFDAVFPSCDPAVFSSWGVGVRRYGARADGDASGVDRDVAMAAISIDYGLPGKPGYSYRRPFDYFHLDATVTSSEDAVPESVDVRGLLVGRDFSYGSRVCGVLGLYGTYDYFSPQVFTLSSTALAGGTTWQHLVSDDLAVQGSLLAGVGFTSTGTTADRRAERSYRYSVSPQGLVALRAVFRDVAMLDVTASEYFLADSLDSTGATGSENVARVQVSLTVRVAGHHAVTLGYLHARRDASFEDVLFDVPQGVDSLSVSYTHLSDRGFGVVRR